LFKNKGDNLSSLQDKAVFLRSYADRLIAGLVINERKVWTP